MGKRVSDKFTVDDMTFLLSVKSTDEYNEQIFNSWSFICDNEACDHSELNCPDVVDQSERYTKYIRAVETVFRDVCEKHHLQLISLPNSVYRVAPALGKTWKHAANEMRLTINGMGPFYFNTLTEFLRSGPYSPRSAVLNHMHWLKNFYDVYEGGTARNRVDRELR